MRYRPAGELGGAHTAHTTGARTLPLVLRDTARAMSQENVEIVRAASTRATRGDLDAWSAEITTPTSWSSSRRRFQTRRPIEGRTAIARHVAGLAEPWEDFRLEADRAHRRWRRRGRECVAPSRYGRARAGSRWTSTCYVSSPIRDGKLVRLEMFFSDERRPSKPWGCRSKTLTPTPEPAGYCAGDVAGERGDRAQPSDRDAFNRRCPGGSGALGDTVGRAQPWGNRASNAGIHQSSRRRRCRAILGAHRTLRGRRSDKRSSDTRPTED